MACAMSSAPVVMRGEVWFAAHDPVRDHEQGGERPCLVVSNNRMNASPADLVVVLPITTTDRRLPTRVAMMPDEACLDRRVKASWACACRSRGCTRAASVALTVHGAAIRNWM